MNKEFVIDAKIAIHNIAGYACSAIKNMVKVLAFFAAVSATVLVVGALVLKFPLYSAIAGVLGAVGTVFVIELKTVRWTREKEEQQEAYRAEKSKPAHPEYQEQQ